MYCAAICGGKIPVDQSNGSHKAVLVTSSCRPRLRQRPVPLSEIHVLAVGDVFRWEGPGEKRVVGEGSTVQWLTYSSKSCRQHSAPRQSSITLIVLDGEHIECGSHHY